MIESKAQFFVDVKKAFYPKGLNQKHVVGIEAIVDTFYKCYPKGDDRFLAYILATAYHETNATFEPVKEAYWLSESWRKRNLRYYPYYGRGFVQITWKANYNKAQLELPKYGFELKPGELVNTPDRVLDPTISAYIIVLGSVQGWFTGKKLKDYFGTFKSNPIGARKIINGTDKNKLIAGYYEKFLKVIKEAK